MITCKSQPARRFNKFGQIELEIELKIKSIVVVYNGDIKQNHQIGINWDLRNYRTSNDEKKSF